MINLSNHLKKFVFLSLAFLTINNCDAFAGTTSALCGGTGAPPSGQGIVTGVNLLQNPGFEGTYPYGPAPSWIANVWGTNAETFNSTTNNPHGGSTAQVITLSNVGNGGALLKQTMPFPQDHTYQASIWMKSQSGQIPVQIFLRDDTGQFFYTAYAVKTFTVQPYWQQFTIQGSFNTNINGSFGINVEAPGTVYVDDASVTDVTPVNDTSVALSQAIPKDYFGMHMLCKGCYSSYWPAVQFGIWRFWDNGTSWQEIETARGTYNWTSFDWFVSQAEANNTDILYTFGHVPQWASSQPAASNYDTYPPANEQDWINYVQAIAGRYKGKIKYYELWNESDQSSFWNGTAQQLVTMAQDAYRTIKATDPNALVIAPNFQTPGLWFMDSFLYSGGIGSFDLMSMHIYPTTQPENDVRFAMNMRSLMNEYGLTNVQMFNTEGATTFTSSTVQNTTASAPSDRGDVGRAYVLNWLYGMGNFNWYTWDYRSPSFLMVSANNSSGQPTVLTNAGTAYLQIGNWLTGAAMTGKQVTNDGTWEVDVVLANGQPGHIVWNTNGTVSYTIKPSCGATTQSDLAGNVTKIAGHSSIQIGISPVLLK